MGQIHVHTPAQRAQWATHMLAHAHEYGIVSTLSRDIQVSHQTLHA